MAFTEDLDVFFSVDGFATRMKWTKSGSTAIVDVIFEEGVEIFGDHGDFARMGKTITGKVSAIGGAQKGDTLQAVNAAGVGTGPTYRVVRAIEDDGAVVTFEVVT